MGPAPGKCLSAYWNAGHDHAILGVGYAYALQYRDESLLHCFSVLRRPNDYTIKHAAMSRGTISGETVLSKGSL
jgi:hypothetical protein